MSELAAAAPTPPLAAVLKRHVTAAVIGNALEFYDFTTYAYFATQIGNAFFPGDTPFMKLILALITFGVGFATRPIGAIVIGRYADRAGRKPAMLFSLTLMGLSIVGLALTPSYRQIGLAAPFLVLAWRLAQGFALGGEVGPTTAFLVEAAPPAKRGLYGAWQSTSQNFAAIAGGLVGVTIASIAGGAQLEAWGWRIAFLLGALILPFGYFLRRTLPETLHRHEARLSIHPERPHLRGHARVLSLGVALIGGATVATYVLGYMTTYAIHTLHMSAGIALGATIANGSAGVIGGLAGGLLSDRYGRRPLMIWPRIAFLAAIWPAFTLMVARHDAVTLLAATFVVSILSALTTASVLVGLTESLDKSVRGIGMGAVYAIAVSVFGGTTQPIIAALTEATGNPLSPAWYMMGANLIALIASFLYRESAHARLAPITP
ncbi:MAG TPA: MFS transporter [Caulobacteraceae bacterium]|jgi:MFS family permease